MCWVENFSDVPQCKKFFMKGTTPNLPGILVNGTVQNQTRYKPICQLFNNTYMFATLYDTTKRIPVFSAYTFTGYTTGRPRQSWMIESQLEDIKIEEMKTQHEMKELNNNTDITVDHQAVDADYKYNNMSMDRGHLFPCSYAPDDAAKRSTFTLTNIVPQESSFNGGRWCVAELKVREALWNNCKKNNNKIEANVVTGAVPSNNKLNLVNIPDLLWTAFCCETSKKDNWIAGAYWGDNKEELNEKELDTITLAKLYEKLNDHYHGDGVVKVFPDQCPKDDIPEELLKDKDKKDKTDQNNLKRMSDVQGILTKRRKVDILRELPLRDGDVHDHCVYDDDCVCSSVGVKGYYLPVVFVSFFLTFK
ncbi:endonuclease domain-containing 1 protein-like [Salmo trutta]|uniref:Endonuclease domain-containing 1 protein-like n=1 Tax=Salmo trutta TaxID=8032 RepID=A0A674APN8_SALTR|nr:endonuclease domain-containing 1 protein-like [Salmo trutta]